MRDDGAPSVNCARRVRGRGVVTCQLDPGANLSRRRKPFRCHAREGGASSNPCAAIEAKAVPRRKAAMTGSSAFADDDIRGTFLARRVKASNNGRCSSWTSLARIRADRRSAFGRIPENICSSCAFPLLTHRRHSALCAALPQGLPRCGFQPRGLITLTQRRQATKGGLVRPGLSLCGRIKLSNAILNRPV
jgi:hypothetical protein